MSIGRSALAAVLASLLALVAVACGEGGSGGEASSVSVRPLDGTAFASSLGVGLTSLDGDVVLIDGFAGSPASTEVRYRDKTMTTDQAVPLIDVGMWWLDGKLILAGFDCPSLNPASVLGETEGDCGMLSVSVLQVDFETSSVTVIAQSIATPELPLGPLVGRTLMIGDGLHRLNVDDGTVSDGAASSPGASVICASGDGTIEVVPKNTDPGDAIPTVIVKQGSDETGREVDVDLPWGDAPLRSITGCTAQGVAVTGQVGEQIQVVELTRSGENVNVSPLAGPGLPAGSYVVAARDQRTIVATMSTNGSESRSIWAGGAWVPVPPSGASNPTLVTVAGGRVFAVTGGSDGAMLVEVED